MEIMDSPKFKVGDRVQDKSEHGAYIKGTISKIESITVVTIHDEGGGTRFTYGLDDIEHAKLTEEDAWIEAALMVGREVQYFTDEPYRELNEIVRSQIRHQAYQILGGNGIKVDEEVKARVRSLIERAKARG